MTRNSRRSVDKLCFHNVFLSAAQCEQAGTETGKGKQHQSREEKGVVQQPKVDTGNGEERQQHSHNRFARNQPGSEKHAGAVCLVALCLARGTQPQSAVDRQPNHTT